MVRARSMSRSLRLEHLGRMENLTGLDYSCFDRAPTPDGQFQVDVAYAVPGPGVSI